MINRSPPYNLSLTYLSIHSYKNVDALNENFQTSFTVHVNTNFELTHEWHNSLSKLPILTTIDKKAVLQICYTCCPPTFTHPTLFWILGFEGLLIQTLTRWQCPVNPLGMWWTSIPKSDIELTKINITCQL